MHDSVRLACCWLTLILCALLLGSALMPTVLGQNQPAQHAVANQKATDSQSSEMRQQSDDTVYYAESWKKGTQQIQEQKLTIRLDGYYPKYESVIKDISGKDHYKLIVGPRYLVWDASRKVKIKDKPSDTKDSSISYWTVQLIEPGDSFSVLAASREHKHTIDVEDYLTSLAPLEDTNWIKVGIVGVPISRKRVIKVEEFYCVIKVKSYQFSRTKARAFEWLELEIEFTNNYKLGWRWN